ncbi:uncharacterized protein Z520_11541 [Fonsecaea multimorphosa CBS 102226]|uniref:Muconate cycloisomerase 1 n=1 Tax=Fonsecaea multimorphosa CBS 102226 TaxID=1442371 RepID=A0A0D2JQC0_9EURO|nr:uncharacterized protein Z520_11541 [Fonsecaea multimorphosa CBS 102226]KIX92689.1 hypothetical protein Z520_11541 [Fonsecaea multimorphosa CBS 102226]OAL17932.1 hypothetical protein AYO22_11088 [Fonsecaea multimorphosa]
MTETYDFLVGTFNTPEIYTLIFTPPLSSSRSSSGKLEVLHCASAIGSHSWLHLSPVKGDGTRNLYATAWTTPPAVAAYTVKSPTDIQLLNSAPTESRSGYVTANDVALYSVGGATGEVFSLDPKSGKIIAPLEPGHTEANGVGRGNSPEIKPLQHLSFVLNVAQRDDGSVMDFGGLRHGAHSADLSPDGRALYVADIGRNCIWSYLVDTETGKLTHERRQGAPRREDGPRHVWPHPTGKVVYCVQEHTSIVDVYSTYENGLSLHHEQAVRIIPVEKTSKDYWADEVRTSLSSGDKPKYLYASVRGLKEGTKGWVAVYRLTDEGKVKESLGPHRTYAATPMETGLMPDIEFNASYGGLQYLWETPTSGGWANAIQPGPTIDGVEYLAMTDSEQGFVFVLGWDGVEMKEVARTKLNDGAGAATAVWL